METRRPDNIIKLSDGRRLGYAEYGETKGEPVMLFHGNLGSRLGWMPLRGNNFRSGLRIIAPDRPGFGLSDFKPERSHIDWPDDVVELADALGLNRFAVAGVSGGGPYVLACAWKIPDRLTKVGVISSGPPVKEALAGVSRTNRLLFSLGRNAPGLIRLNSKFLASMACHDPDRMLRVMLSSYSDSDKAILDRPEVQEFFRRDMQEAFRQGGRGSAHEVILHSRPWPFPLEQIEIEVRLWHGEEDTATPVSMGRFMARVLPNCEARFIPEAGHLWILDNINEVLETLVPQKSPNHG